MSDLELQLAEAQSTRISMMQGHERDKEVLIAQLNKADARVDQLLEELRIVRKVFT